MDKILLAIGIFLFIFIAVMVWLFYTCGATPDVLISCVFVAATGELGFMSRIQTNRERKQERTWQLEDEKRNRDNMIEDEERNRKNMIEDEKRHREYEKEDAENDN